MKKNTTLIISITLVASLLTGCNNVGKVSYKKEAKPLEYAEALKENWNKTNFSKKLGVFGENDNYAFDIKNDLYVDTVLDVYGEESYSLTYEGNKKGSYSEKLISKGRLEEEVKYDYDNNNIEVSINNKLTNKSFTESGNEKITDNSKEVDNLTCIMHAEMKGDKLAANSYDVNRKLYSSDEGSGYDTISEALTDYCLNPYDVYSIWENVAYENEEIVDELYLDMEGFNLYVDGNKLTIEQSMEQEESEEVLGVKVHTYMKTSMVDQYVFSKNTITFISYMYLEMEDSHSKDGCEEKEYQITEFLSKTKVTLKNVKIKEPNKDKYTKVDDVYTSLDL